MRKSSILILFISILSIVISMYVLRNIPQLVSNYAIDNNNHIPLSKGNLVLIGLVPFVVVFTMDIVATLEAEEVRPFIRYYDRLKYVICFAFQLLFVLIVLSQIYIINEKYVLGSILSIVIFYVGYTAAHLPQNQVIGFKNKWTLDSAYVWDKVHQRIRTVSIMIGIMVILTTFVKDLTVTIIAIALVAMSIIYLLYYSYKTSNNKPSKHFK